MDRDASCYGDGENTIDDMIERVLNMSEERVMSEISKENTDPTLVLTLLRERLANSVVDEPCDRESGEIVEFPPPKGKEFCSLGPAKVISISDRMNSTDKRNEIDEGLQSERWVEEDRNYAGTIGRRLWRVSLLTDVPRRDSYFYEKASSVARAVRFAQARVSKVFQWHWDERKQQRSQ